MIHALAVSLGSAVVVAAMLSLATIGFTLRYAVSGVFDLTYGALMGAMLIAYICASAGINLWAAMILSGGCTRRAAARPTPRKCREFETDLGVVAVKQPEKPR
jgi:branched-subunit amino acid ABC-type transport system permease component